MSPSKPLTPPSPSPPSPSPPSPSPPSPSPPPFHQAPPPIPKSSKPLPLAFAPKASLPVAQTLHFSNLIRWCDMVQHTTVAASFFPCLEFTRPAYITPPAPVAAPAAKVLVKMSLNAVALVLAALLSVLGTTQAVVPTMANDPNTCPNLSIAGPPKCFVNTACSNYPIATRTFDVGAAPHMYPGGGSVSVAISGANWVITYAFTGYVPVAGQTVIQLILLEGNTTTPSQSGTSYQNWTANYAPTCDQTKNMLSFFFLWGSPNATGAVATQPTGTTISYKNSVATIIMPIATKLLPWTYNLNSKGQVNNTALCPMLHGKPGGIFLVTGIYTKGVYAQAGSYANNACQYDLLPINSHMNFVLGCNCTYPAPPRPAPKGPQRKFDPPNPPNVPSSPNPSPPSPPTPSPPSPPLPGAALQPISAPPLASLPPPAPPTPTCLPSNFMKPDRFRNTTDGTTYFVASRSLAINGIANAGKASLAISGLNWIITYNFTAFVPTAATRVQMTFMEGASVLIPSPYPSMFVNWTTTVSKTCDQTKDQLNFFFLWGQPMASGAMATQPSGTTVAYTATTAVITMPISTPYLPWTNNKPYDTTALCCHIKPLYMLTGVYTNGAYNQSGVYPGGCNYDLAPVASTLPFQLACLSSGLRPSGTFDIVTKMLKAVAIVWLTALISITAAAPPTSYYADPSSCPALTVATAPACFVNKQCGYYPVATKTFNVGVAPVYANGGSASIAINGSNWVITYAFTGYVPVAGQTVIQLTFLEGNNSTPGQSGTSYQNWTSNYASTCDQTKNSLNFFFLWGYPTYAGAVSTQPAGTTTTYRSSVATIVMPIASMKLPWTYNVNSKGVVNATALCPGIHAKPGGIFLLTGVYNKTLINTGGSYAANQCQYDTLPINSAFNFVLGCNCTSPLLLPRHHPVPKPITAQPIPTLTLAPIAIPSLAIATIAPTFSQPPLSKPTITLAPLAITTCDSLKPLAPIPKSPKPIPTLAFAPKLSMPTPLSPLPPASSPPSPSPPSPSPPAPPQPPIDPYTCPAAGIAGPPVCFTNSDCTNYLVASTTFDVAGHAGAGTASIHINGSNWVITYVFSKGYVPVMDQTVIQMTFLEGNTITPGQSGTSYQNWTANYAPTCDQTKNLLNFFFLWKEPNYPNAEATEPAGTTVMYRSNSATIVMPIATAKLPWTNNMFKNGTANNAALCLHSKPGGIFMVTGIYNKQTYKKAGTYTSSTINTCKYDLLPANSHMSFVLSCNCTNASPSTEGSVHSTQPAEHPKPSQRPVTTLSFTKPAFPIAAITQPPLTLTPLSKSSQPLSSFPEPTLSFPTIAKPTLTLTTRHS
ncbi:MAG: hypothetical protein WDW38_007751 [Sanguina aurantia]